MKEGELTEREVEAILEISHVRLMCLDSCVVEPQRLTQVPLKYTARTKVSNT